MKRNASEPGCAPDAVTDDGFLHRWSTRKANARRRAKAPVVTTPDTPAATAAKDERALTDADMPPIASLTPESDFRPFLSPGVSEELRRAALRRLFRSAAFNELCPLEGEFFDAQGYEPLGAIVTHEMRAQIEREALRLKAQARAAIESPGAEEPISPADVPSATAADTLPAREAEKIKPARTDKLTRVSKRRRLPRARKS